MPRSPARPACSGRARASWSSIAANAGLSGAVTLQANGGLVVGSPTGLGTGTVTATGDTSLFATDYSAGVPVTQTINNNIVINTGTLNLRGDDNLTLAGSITNSGGNRNLTANMQQAASGDLVRHDQPVERRDQPHADHQQQHVRRRRQDERGRRHGQHRPARWSTAARSTASDLTKGGVGLVVLSNNTNSYAGITTVSGGVLLVTANSALGANGSMTTNQTTINNGTHVGDRRRPERARVDCGPATTASAISARCG